MNLEILLPFRIFARKAEVSSIVAETPEGSFGILPHRLDCVAALVPGILAYACEVEGTAYFALDGGALVKRGNDVVVTAHRAVAGADLGALQQAVRQEFLSVGTRELEVRVAIAKMESGLLGRLREFQLGR